MTATKNRKLIKSDVLIPDQMGVYNALLKFVNGDVKGMFLLKGYAGTGKTYTLTKFIKDIIVDGNIYVAMTAPTNKAVKVLRQFSDFKSSQVEFRTIHSLLGLKEKIHPNGEVTFEPDNFEPASINQYNIIIIDESSMLGDKLFGYVVEHAENVKIIFTGDPKQIPPVGELDSKVFMQKYQDLHSIQVVELDKIMRQKEGNPIIEHSMQIRTSPANDLPLIEASHGTEIILIDNAGLEEIDATYETLFDNEMFRKDSDHAKVIAWTNKTVDWSNDRIRRLIYKRDIGKIEVGDKLIANSPILEGRNKIKFHTNDEFEVMSFNIQSKKINGVTIMYYEATVKYYNVEKGKHMENRIEVVHEDSDSVFQSILKKIADSAKQETNRQEASRIWAWFYEVKRKFADVKYGYAITCHKSQGSTYRNVILIESDILKNRKLEELQRIMYTAVTRASDKLFIIRR